MAFLNAGLRIDCGSATFEEVRYGLQRLPELRHVQDQQLEEALASLLTQGQLWIEAADKYLWTGDTLMQ